MKGLLKDKTIIVCGTVVLIWAIAAATVLIVTGNYIALRSLLVLLSPAVSSLAVLLGTVHRIRNTESQVLDKVEAVHQQISNGDGTEATP